MKYVWLIYLQFLFVAGQFNTKKNWIDKHVLMCYNKLDELNVDYVKFHDIDKKNKRVFIQMYTAWEIIFYSVASPTMANDSKIV